jgi:MFS family permease
MGWRPLFFITGAIGALWLIPWFIFAPRGILKKSGGTGSVGFRQLLGRREAWGTFGGLFGANYAWYFVLSWLPSYLVHERKLTMGSVAIWGALPYLFMAVSSVAGGYLADRFIARGASPVRIRRAFVSTGLLLAACLMPLCLLPRIEFALAGLFITCLAFGIYVSNLWALTQTLAGPTLAGRWTGLQNAGGNIAGILSPALTGYLVSVHGNFTWAFLAAGIGCLFGSASFRLMIRDRAADGAIPQE